MKSINITEVRSDWFIATMVMEDGKIYKGIAKNLILEINKKNLNSAQPQAPEIII